MLLLLAIAVALAHVLLSLLAIACPLDYYFWRLLSLLRTVLLLQLAIAAALCALCCCRCWRLPKLLLMAIAVARCALCCCRWRLPSVLLLAIAIALCALCCCCCRCWRLPSLLRTVHCAAAAPRGSARAGTPQLATTTTSRELEQTRACGKKN
ncbi:unnamed protein product [Sphagnum tenellum]